MDIDNEVRRIVQEAKSIGFEIDPAGVRASLERVETHKIPTTEYEENHDA